MSTAMDGRTLAVIGAAWLAAACSAPSQGSGGAGDAEADRRVPDPPGGTDLGGVPDPDVAGDEGFPPLDRPDPPVDPTGDPLQTEDRNEDVVAASCPTGRTPVPWVVVEEGPPVRLRPDCPGAGLEVSFPGAGVLRLRYVGTGPHPTLPYATSDADLGPAPDVSFGPRDDRFVACAGGLAVEVTPATCAVRVTDPDGAILVEDEPGGAYGEGEWPPGTSGPPLEAASVSGARDPPGEPGAANSGSRRLREKTSWARRGPEAAYPARVELAPPGREALWKPPRGTARWITRRSPPQERFYGLGEKAGYDLDRRGRTWTFWNSDHPAYGAETDPLYVSVPFFVGLREGRAYGVFMNNTHRQVLDLAASDPTRYRWEVAAGEVDQFVFAGPSIAQVLERFTALTGRPFLPPRWTLGYHQSRWSYWPDSRVIEVCEGFRERDIPADGVWLDIDHMDGFRSWTWDPVGFPDPSGLVAAVEDLGFEVTAIVDPGLKVDPDWDVYQAGIAGGHFLAGADGTPFVGEVWSGPAVFPDFTRAETRAWWGSLAPRLTDHGVWGLWLDMNEPASFQEEHGWTLPDDVTASGEGTGTTMAEVHNVYALAEAWATWDGARQAVPGRRPFLLTRAGFAGIQRFAAVWTGDAASSFEALRMTLPMLLGLGLSGVPFVGSDVGGWTGFASPELFARWMAVGSVSPFFRGHVQQGTPDQEPWAFGVEVEDISRIHLKQRYRWLPYLYSLMWEASRTGAPVLRPLVFEFQDDPGTWDVADEAMLGPWLLVAPAVDPGAKERSVVLPPGRFLEWRSGAVWEGPATLVADLTLQALPVYLREGGVVPGGPDLRFSDEAPLDPLTLEVFPGPRETEVTLYEDDGVSTACESGEYAATRFRVQATATGAVLRADPRTGALVPGDRRVRVRVRPVDGEVASVVLDGSPLPPASTLEELDQSPEGWVHDVNDRALVVVFADRAPFRLEMTYDPALEGPAPDVLVPLRVHVPAGTPHAPPVHVSTSASGWQHQPLAWSPTDPDTAEGAVRVPRGKWFEYKYTRGSWATVEKWAGCLEATNRYHFGQAHPVQEDVVEAWADQCRFTRAKKNR